MCVLQYIDRPRARRSYRLNLITSLDIDITCEIAAGVMVRLGADLSANQHA